MSLLCGPLDDHQNDHQLPITSRGMRVLTNCWRGV